ncbi:helix-turn-helix domain-containing protein [Phytoactinopolyspora limicola]|uniref:helix-turn-helix domain-containing protein n=1 Tax=Phytoactinopolyspora limicola TaxID=2715536 RepID=UPI0014092AB7|nr:AraC family transcriptional regulator [Phytoactinopolyspora limicola]
MRFEARDSHEHQPAWLTLPTVLTLTPGLRDHTVSSIEDMERELEERGPHFGDAVNLLAQQLFLRVHRAYLNGVAAVGVNPPASHSSVHHADMIDDLIHYVSRNLTEDLSVAKLAQRYAVSESHLRRVVREWTGLAPRDYVVQARLRRAKELLEARYKVGEAAAAVGYQDAFYFSRLFHKHVGHSPTDFLRARTTRRFPETSEKAPVPGSR